MALEVSELNSVYRSPLYPHPHPHLTLPLCWHAAFAEEEAAYVSASATRIQRKRYASRAPLSPPASLFQAPPRSHHHHHQRRHVDASKKKCKSLPLQIARACLFSRFKASWQTPVVRVIACGIFASPLFLLKPNAVSHAICV